MNQFIERMNYESDSRVNAVSPRIAIEIYNADTDQDDEIELPTKWEICDICNGNAKHVNPSIDAGGLCDDMRHDQEFMDDYMSGRYDVPCSPCKGSGKVLVPDYDFLTIVQQEALQEQQEADYASAMESRAERMMGA